MFGNVVKHGLLCLVYYTITFCMHCMPITLGRQGGIVYIFAHSHTVMRTEGNMLDMN